MRTGLLVLVLALAATPAAADEGELYLGAAGALEAATLRHPLGDSPFDVPLAPFSVLPRLMFGARFGVTNELHLGVALDAAAAANILTNDVVVGRTAARLVTGTYLELGAPASIGWRVDSGYDFSVTAAIELAPMFTTWFATAATEPTKLSEPGLARRLPFEVADAFNAGVAARFQLSFDARLLGDIGIHIGAYVGAASAGSSSLRFGLVVASSWDLPLGPL